MRLRRSTGGPLLERRAAEIVRGVVLYAATATAAGIVGLIVVSLSSAS